MKNLLILLSVAIIGSCTNPGTKSHLKNIESQIVVTDKGEDFSSFYHFFVDDSIFQAERVVFPFDLVRSHINAEGMEAESVFLIPDKSDWQYYRMPAYQESEGANRELIFNNDSTEVDLKIPDIQTTISTSFIMEDGKWYLSSYTASAEGNGW